MSLWDASLIVRHKNGISTIIAIWSLVHFMSQTTHGYVGVKSYQYLSSVKAHNKYILEFWKATQSDSQHLCYINGNSKERNIPKTSLKSVISEVASEKFASSVWCLSSPESGLRCHFRNLHYSHLMKEFIFVLGLKSVIYGISDIKSLQANLFLSSVLDHNAFPFRVTVLPCYMYASSYSSIVINGDSLFVARFKPDNLQHVFHDDLIPIYFTLRELCGVVDSCINTVRLVFTDENERNLYWHLYQTLSGKIALLSDLEVTDSHSWYCFESAYFGVNKLSVWYQYGYGKPQGPQIQSSFSGHLLREFTDFMKDRLSLQQPTVTVKTVVMISRKSNRKILNENELAMMIRNYFWKHTKQDYSIKVLSLEEHSISYIISELSTACLLVGVHGAALVLGIFLPPGSALVEIWPYGISPSVALVYKAMCSLRGFGVTYIPWVNEDAVNTVYHPEYPSHIGGLGHLLKSDQERMLRELYERKIETLECCDNATWLFRIYQDTTVLLSDKKKELKSVPFTAVLHTVLKVQYKPLQSNIINHNIIEQLYPSKVQDFSWLIVNDNCSKILRLQWKDPWNIEGLSCDKKEFEIIIDTHWDSDPQKYLVSIGRFEKVLKSELRVLDVWITCFCNEIEGSLFYTRLKIS